MNISEASNNKRVIESISTFCPIFKYKLKVWLLANWGKISIPPLKCDFSHYPLCQSCFFLVFLDHKSPSQKFLNNISFIQRETWTRWHLIQNYLDQLKRVSDMEHFVKNQHVVVKNELISSVWSKPNKPNHFLGPVFPLHIVS